MNISLDFFLNSVAEKAMNSGISSISPYSSPVIKLLYLFGYYHYINANDMDFDVLEKSIFAQQNCGNHIGGIFLIDDETVTYDVVCPFYLKSAKDIDDLEMAQFVRDSLQEFVNPSEISCSKQEISSIRKIKETDRVTFRIITNVPLNPERKAALKRLLSSHNLPFSNWSVDLSSSDDIIEEISDTEEPQKFVEEDSVVLCEPNNISFHGSEKSFVASISACSLRDVYRAHSTKGLFASNLRYYVKSLKIDNAINETIKNHPDDFWYFNNGIIVTCEGYSINGNRLILKNFSIVNGGQTTNIIGNSDFTQDFAVLCKVICSKKQSKKENEEFIEGVAMASNSQKPIKSKDLIANRPEQKHLKTVMGDCGIFLQIKRGDRVNKAKYPLAWQTSSNEEIAQLLYAALYQNPVMARNNVSKLFSNEDIYKTIFTQETSASFIKDLIVIKTAYQEWISPKNKHGACAPIRPDIAKLGMMYVIGSIALISKSLFNAQLIECVRTSNDDNAKIQFFIEQRDIGFSGILRSNYDYEDLRSDLFSLFSKIERDILIEGFAKYQRFKGEKIGSPANYVRDSNYYRSTVVCRLFDDVVDRIDKKVFHQPTAEEKETACRRFISDYRPGLKVELLALRNKITKNTNKSEKIPLSDIAIGQIVRLMPRSQYELAQFTSIRQDILEEYSQQIIAIVKKYDTPSSDSITITSTNSFHN